MHFSRIEPIKELANWIECFWLMEDDTTQPQQQKIIPDGFTEIIFHLADPYRICIDGVWKGQSKSLLAGQISKHFFLENTGRSSMVGIKLKPTACTHLYGITMRSLLDKVEDIHILLKNEWTTVEEQLHKATGDKQKIAILTDYFVEYIKQKEVKSTTIDSVVNKVFETHGMITVASMCDVAGVGERQIENLFKKYVGLSPKYFARIVRFNYIFELIQHNKQDWNDLAYEAAYYDQSHFIKNFKDFTGENPTDYAFDEKNLANFFLRKQ